LRGRGFRPSCIRGVQWQARGRRRSEQLRRPTCPPAAFVSPLHNSIAFTGRIVSVHISPHSQLIHILNFQYQSSSVHILSSNTGHIAVRSQHLSDVCVCRCCCWRRYVLQAGVVLLQSALLSSLGRCCAAVGFPGRMDPRGMKTRHVPMAHEST
jgi:hypothetical protein